MVEISRNPEDIQSIGDFATIVPGAEKGHFFCEGGGRPGDPGVPPGQDYGGTVEPGKCGKNLSSAATKVINNGQDYVVRCGRCGRTLFFNAGWLAAKIIKAQQQEAALGIAPAVGSFPDVLPPHREEPLPDGRKRIIVTPGAAIQRPRAHRGRTVIR